MESEEFKKLEGEYKFLSRAREQLSSTDSELEGGQYIIVDLETTGLNPAQNEIIEIGAIKVERGEAKDIFNKLVKPKAGISPEITRITGITDEMVENAPDIEAVLPEFLRFAGSGTLIAHNADFDIPFLNEKLKLLNKALNNKAICTLKCARAILPNLENHKLHTVAHYFGISISGRHRAIGDCEATYQVWLKLLAKLRERNINTKADLDKLIKEAEAARAPF